MLHAYFILTFSTFIFLFFILPTLCAINNVCRFIKNFFRNFLGWPKKVHESCVPGPVQSVYYSTFLDAIFLAFQVPRLPFYPWITNFPLGALRNWNVRPNRRILLLLLPQVHFDIFFLFSWKDGRWQLALVGMYTLSKIWPKEFGCSSFSFVLFSLTNFRLTWVFNVCPSNERKCSSLFHTDTPSPVRPYAHFVDRKT